MVNSGGKTVTTVFLVGTNKHLLELREEYPTLEELSQAPSHKFTSYHSKAKEDLIKLVNKERHFGFNTKTPTIGIGQEKITPEVLPAIYTILHSLRKTPDFDYDLQILITGQIPDDHNAEHIRKRLNDWSAMYDINAQYLPLNRENALTIAAGVDVHLDSFPPPTTQQSPMGLLCMKQGVPQWTSRYALRDGIRGGRFIFGDAMPEYGSEQVLRLYAQNQMGAIKSSWQRQVCGVLTSHDLYAAHMIDAIMATTSADNKVLDRPVEEIITTPQQEVVPKYSMG